MYRQEGAFFICKYNPPKANLVQSSFIGTYNQVFGMRDSMGGGIVWGAVMDIAKIKYQDDELEDFIDFVGDCEREINIKRNEESKAKK